MSRTFLLDLNREEVSWKADSAGGILCGKLRLSQPPCYSCWKQVKQQTKENACSTNATTKDLFSQAVGSLISFGKQEASLHMRVIRARAHVNYLPSSPSSFEDPHARWHPQQRWRTLLPVGFLLHSSTPYYYFIMILYYNKVYHYASYWLVSYHHKNIQVNQTIIMGSITYTSSYSCLNKRILYTGK